MSFDVVRFIQIRGELSSPRGGLAVVGPEPVDDAGRPGGRRRYRGRMRWDALFADLEAQFETGQAAELAAEVAELTRAEVGAIALADRLHAQVGRELVWWTVSGERLAGALVEAGADWVLVGTARQEWLLPLVAVAAVGGLTRDAEPAAGSGVRRLPLTVVLRRLSRDRELVEMTVAGGRQFLGTVDRVAADHVDLAVRRPDEPLRDAAERVAVPLAALVGLRVG